MFSFFRRRVAETPVPLSDAHIASLQHEADKTYQRLRRFMSAEPSYDAVLSRLRSGFYRQLGSGAFGRVFRCGRLVCKLAHNDGGYPHYATLAMQEAGQNPYFPVVVRHERFPSSCRDSITFLEALTHVPAEMKDRRSRMREYLYNGAVPDTEDPHLIQMVSKVRALKEAYSLDLDCPARNFMYRPSTKTVVLTDPFVG